MFIITLWDIGAVIFFLVCIVIALKTWIESNINAKQYERKNEPKPEPKKEPKKEAPFWMCAIALVIVLAAIYAYCAWRGWLH